MKNKIGIWIDKSKAIIVSMNDTNIDIKEIKPKNLHETSAEHQKKLESYRISPSLYGERMLVHEKEKDYKSYIETVADALKDAEEVYLFGPAATKNTLRNYLLTHLSTFNFKLKSNETTDTLTVNQIVTKVKNYFRFNLAY